MLNASTLSEIEKSGAVNEKTAALLIKEIRTLQQQNKQLVEAIGKITNIDPDRFDFYQYLYYVCCIESDVMESIQGGVSSDN